MQRLRAGMSAAEGAVHGVLLAFPIALFTLTLAIGANTAIFSIVNGMLLQPLPFPEQHELIQFMRGFPEGGVGGSSSVPKYTYWEEHTRDQFEAACGATAGHEAMWRLLPGPSHPGAR